MRYHRSSGALILLTGAFVLGIALSDEPKHVTPQAKPLTGNPYGGMQERVEVFEFTQKPKVKKDGDKWTITFASKAACDATVAIVNKDGKVIRHLASGVLGKNAPYPFQQNALAQKLEWDGKDDDGKPVPSGCTVKVSLGLDARFDKLEMWALASAMRCVAVGKEGDIYTTAESYGITGTLQVFGTDGKLLRTILPPPAVSREEAEPRRFTPIAWNKTVKGEWVPRLNRAGGSFSFGLTKYDRFFSGNIKLGTVTADGKLGIVNAPNRGGDSTLLLLDPRDGSCPDGNSINLGQVVTDGLAASPDGKWLYLAGRQKHPFDKGQPFSHAILRLALEKPGKPEVCVGDVGKEGNDNAHFNGPDRVACDKEGNVYVGDSGNRRIQVFKPNGTHVKTIPDVPGKLIGVSHKTGAVYIFHQINWEKNPFIIKLGGLDNPVKVAEIEISCSGQWRDGMQSAMLGCQTDPPVVWFTGSSYQGKPVVVAIEDQGKKLAQTVDLVKTNNAVPTDKDYYLTTPGMWRSLHVDRRTGELVWDHPVGPDGLRYQRSQYYSAPKGMPDNKMWVVRYDPRTKEYVPFAQGEQAGVPDPRGEFGGSYSPWVQKGKPVIGIPMYLARGPRLHQGPFCIGPNGDIYVGATYAPQTDAELEKAGLPRLQPKRLPAFCAPVLRIYGPDGKLKTPCALPGLAELEGLRVGRSGAGYVVQPWRPMAQKLPDGLANGAYEETRWGSLIKFAGDFKTFPVGRIEGAWEATPASPTHASKEYKVKVSGAVWTYGGVSPHSGLYTACTCMKAGADLDDYERSFVCAAQTCTVNVIDSNGNVMARLGGYGNLDQMLVRDPKSGELRPRQRDDPKDLKGPVKPLAFSLPRNVAASDEAMWVADLNQRALIKAALFYRVEESVPVP